MWIILIVLVIVVLIVQPLILLLHELGHALPALIFTRANVEIYIGSSGEQDNSWRIRVGMLELYLKRRFPWTTGLCVSNLNGLPRAQQILVVMGGVTVTVVVAVAGFWAALAFDLHGSIKLLLSLLVVFSLITLVTNLLPVERDGRASDGLVLKHLLFDGELQSAFSPELQALLARSREVALELGYPYISTVHVLLADCTMPYPYALRDLLFADAAALTTFHEEQRIGAANPNPVPLPLTIELDQVLRRATTSRHHGLSQILYPAHLFVAASEQPNSAFAQVVTAEAGLPQILLAHYRSHDELWAH